MLNIYYYDFRKKPMCTIGKWTDPDISEENYTVLVVLPSGVITGEVLIPTSEDGTDEISITYDWSDAFVKMDVLYMKEILEKKYTRSHPEVMAMNESLRKYKTNIDETPKSTIKIKLPVKVQTSHQSYDHDVIVTKLPGGNHLVTVRVRMTAFDTMYIVRSAKKKIKVSFT